MENISYEKELVRSKLFVLGILLVTIIASFIELFKYKTIPVMLFDGLVICACLLGMIRAIVVLVDLRQMKGAVLNWSDESDYEETQQFVLYAAQIYVGELLIFQTKFVFKTEDDAKIVGAYLLSNRFRYAMMDINHQVLDIKKSEYEYSWSTPSIYIDGELCYDVQEAEAAYEGLRSQNFVSTIADENESITKGALLAQVKQLMKENKDLSECIEVLMGHDA